MQDIYLEIKIQFPTMYLIQKADLKIEISCRTSRLEKVQGLFGALNATGITAIKRLLVFLYSDQ